MNPHETNWTPGIIVALVAFTLSALVFLLMRQRASGGTTIRDVRLADLNQRIQLVLEQLRELESERHLEGSSYAAEKARLEQEGAAALRERDTYLKAHPQSAQLQSQAHAPIRPTASAEANASMGPSPSGFWARNRELKGALWGAGIVLFLVVAGLAIVGAERDRGDGEMTGMRPPNDGEDAAASVKDPTARAPTPSPTEDDPHFKAFFERAQQNPQDTEAAAYAGHVLIRENRFDEAQKLTTQALAADPFHLESRIHRAVLRATEGKLREAVDDLGHLAKTYPDSYEALLFRGAIAMQIGETRVALESFERFVAEAPPEEQPPQVHEAMAMLRQRLARPAAP